MARIFRMPQSRISIVARALLAVALTSPAAIAADPWIDFALNDAGDIRLIPRTLAPNDYMMAVYAENLEDLPLPLNSRASAPGKLPTGCLPLVRIDTASGARRLPIPGDLTFGCTDLPANARIHALIDGRWEALPTRRLPDGRLHASFTQTAVYGLFLVDEVPRI